MVYTVPDLPYDYDALEPYIDEKTMRLHHDKHHTGYVDKLNKAIAHQEELSGLAIEKLLQNIDNIPENIRQEVINNAGGHANHSLFWQTMTPNSSKEPEGRISDAIKSTFSSFSAFKEQFSQKALGVFGSGWAFLVVNENKKLEVTRQSFQNSPYMYAQNPILGIDVWEHAYYLKYQNKRADYVNAWWEVVNWKTVQENFEKAIK